MTDTRLRIETGRKYWIGFASKPVRCKVLRILRKGDADPVVIYRVYWWIIPTFSRHCSHSEFYNRWLGVEKAA